mgnify:CR=1 FL=1
MEYAKRYFEEVQTIAKSIELDAIEKMVQIIEEVKNKQGRLFFIGVGGSAANCTHAVNDFRKICGMEAYAPTDNVAELTARTNDEGWDSVFVEWLRGSRLNGKDCVLVFSVGGGNKEKNVSVNLVHALAYAKEQQTKVIGIVGRDGGYTAQVADACCLIPVVNPANTTPHTEAFHAVIWHALVSHPKLKTTETKWESCH